MQVFILLVRQNYIKKATERSEERRVGKES